MKLPAALIALGVCWSHETLAAEERPSRASWKPRPLEVGVGTHAAYADGLSCSREAFDVVSCTRTSGFAGLHVAPRWRLTQFWALGAMGTASWGAAGVDRSQMYWSAAIDGRLHLFGNRGTVPWLGLDAGVVAVADELAADELGPARSYTTTAPAFGLSAGLDAEINPLFAFSLSLRGFTHLFGNLQSVTPTQPEYATQWGAMLSAGLMLRGL